MTNQKNNGPYTGLPTPEGGLQPREAEYQRYRYDDNHPKTPDEVCKDGKKYISTTSNSKSGAIKRNEKSYYHIPRW